jgi:hypothetical protein
MPTSNKINTLLEDLQKRVKNVQKFRSQVHYIFDEIQLLELRKEGTRYPIAGVMFHKRAAVPDSSIGSKSKLGLTATYMFKVLILETHQRSTSVDTKSEVTDLLNDVAVEIVAKAPVGEKLWRFVEDKPLVVTGTDGFMLYEQTWSISAGLL